MFENSVNLIRVQILLVDCEKTALQKTIRHITVITFGYVPFVVKNTTIDYSPKQGRFQCVNFQSKFHHESYFEN